MEITTLTDRFKVLLIANPTIKPKKACESLDIEYNDTNRQIFYYAKENVKDTVKDVKKKMTNSGVLSISSSENKEYKRSTPKIKKNHFLRLLKLFVTLPTYLRHKSMEMYWHFKNHREDATCEKCGKDILSREDQEEEEELSYFLILSYLYDSIDKDRIPDKLTNDFFLEHELGFEETVLDFHAYNLYNKEITELTSEELEEAKSYVEMEKEYNLHLIKNLEKDFDLESDPLKIKYVVLEHELYFNMAMFVCWDLDCEDCNDIFDKRKELAELFKFYNEVNPNEPLSYHYFIEKWLSHTKPSEEEN